MYFQQPLLTPAQLRRLERHKYSAQSSSLLDGSMQRWWNLVVTWIPLWVAPNLITMLGLVINVITSAVVMWQCPTAKEPAPQWSAFACAVGLFIYQTLDAIDGKQARRTNTQSPLGELFDHGCDSLSTVFVTIACACSVSLGHNPSFLLLQCFSASVMFYTAHWQTYVTGTMRFGTFDVTEGQMCVISVMMLTALFSGSMWDYELLGLFSLRLLPTTFALVCAAVSLMSTLQIISNGGAGKNGSTVAATSVITPVIPILVTVIPGVVIAQNSAEKVFEENPILFIMTFCLMAAKVTNKLIVAHMTKSEMSNSDVTLLVPLTFFVRSYVRLSSIITERQLLILSFVVVSADLLVYSACVCREICNHLNVNLFTISSRRTAVAVPSRKSSK